MAKSRGDFTDILLRRQVLSPDQLDEARSIAQQTGAKLADSLVKLGYATHRPDHERHGRAPRPAVRRSDGSHDPRRRHRARPRIGRPRKHRHAALPGKRRAQDHHERPQRLRHRSEAPVHPEQRYPARPGAARADRRGHQPALRPVRDRVGRLDAPSSPTPPSTSPKRKAPAQSWPAPSTRATPRSSSWCTSIIQEAVSLRASDIHIEPFADRVRIRYRIDGVLIERDSAPRRLLGADRSAASRSWASSTSPRSAGPRTAASRSLVAGKDYRPARQHPANQPWPVGASCGSSTATTSRSSIQDLGLRRRRLRAVQADHQTAQRHLAGDRPDRLGQDDHALRRAQRAEPARPQDHHGRGPRRVLPARREPV